MTRQSANSVLIDVTSLISAEEFILSRNRGGSAEDPFARQCFVEVVQSIIFMSKVFVLHPVLSDPRQEDFGARPLLLRRLMEAGLLKPLVLDREQRAQADRFESAMIQDLQSRHGLDSTLRFVDQASLCDQAAGEGQESLSVRLRSWCSFHDRQVRSAPGHHATRIPTTDGVENDEFGHWARAAAVLLHGTLSEMVAPGDGEYLMATLARGLKYQARAQAGEVSYQSHPMRRDFSLTFDLTREGAEDEFVLDLIQAVRGIHDSLAQAVGSEAANRLRLVQLELPLLGGRLWLPSETGSVDDDGWVRLIVERLLDYRSRVEELRMAVEKCVSDEDRLRVARDIDEVKYQILERLGLRKVEMSPVERELVDSVASVAQAAPGVPKVSGLWVSVRSLGKRFGYSAKEPFQRFLYREFVDAWKRSGR